MTTEGREASARERAARAIFDAGGWAGDCCCHTAYEDCADCRRVCLSYADAALAALDVTPPARETTSTTEETS